MGDPTLWSFATNVSLIVKAVILVLFFSLLPLGQLFFNVFSFLKNALRN